MSPGPVVDPNTVRQVVALAREQRTLTRLARLPPLACRLDTHARSHQVCKPVLLKGLTGDVGRSGSGAWRGRAGPTCSGGRFTGRPRSTGSSHRQAGCHQSCLFMQTYSILSFVGKKATQMKNFMIEEMNSVQTTPSASIIFALAGRVRVGWGGRLTWVTLHNVQPGFSCVAALGPAISRTIFSHYSTI